MRPFETQARRLQLSLVAAILVKRMWRIPACFWKYSQPHRNLHPQSEPTFPPLPLLRPPFLPLPSWPSLHRINLLIPRAIIDASFTSKSCPCLPPRVLCPRRCDDLARIALKCDMIFSNPHKDSRRQGGLGAHACDVPNDSRTNIHHAQVFFAPYFKVGVIRVCRTISQSACYCDVVTFSQIRARGPRRDHVTVAKLRTFSS